MKKSLLTDYGKEFLNQLKKEAEEELKFIGPPLPYVMFLERIEEESDEL